MDKNERKTLIFNLITVFLVILVVAVAVKAIICKAKGKINYIFGKYAVMYVVSDSMEPQISRNSYIIIQKKDVTKIKENSIISFVSDDPEIYGNINTHRVVEVLENEFVTKGDNVPVNDPVTAKKDNVVGVYVCNAGLLTAVGNLFMSKLGAIIVFGFLILTIILAIVRVVITANFKEKEMKQDVSEDEQND